MLSSIQESVVRDVKARLLTLSVVPERLRRKLAAIGLRVPGDLSAEELLWQLDLAFPAVQPSAYETV